MMLAEEHQLLHRKEVAIAFQSTKSAINSDDEREQEVIRKYSEDHIAFCKAQAALNKAYRERKEKYNQTPISARMETGKNLKNLRPLAVRKAEFC